MYMFEIHTNVHAHTHTHTLSLSLSLSLCLSLSLSRVTTQWEGGHLQTWKRASWGTRSASTLILNFPAFRTARNKSQLLGHPVCGCYSRQSWLRHIVNNYFWASRSAHRSSVASVRDLAICSLIYSYRCLSFGFSKRNSFQANVAGQSMCLFALFPSLSTPPPRMRWGGALTR